MADQRGRNFPVGESFGDWTVIGAPVKQHTNPDTGVLVKRQVLCRCRCGTERMVPCGALIVGDTTRCLECAQKAHTKNAWKKKHPLFSAWNGIRARCLNKNTTNYSSYGGRGIRVSADWVGVDGFDNFVAYVEKTLGAKPSRAHSIDRIDNEGHYVPGNLRWADSKTQANNRRSSVYVEYRGQNKTVAEWADIYEIEANRVRARIRQGWPGSLALITSSSATKLDSTLSVFSHVEALEKFISDAGLPVPPRPFEPKLKTTRKGK